MSNPATRQLLCALPRCGAQETSQAVAAAAEAFPGWSAKTGKARSSVMRKWHDLVLQRQEELATIVTLEGGKPLAEARAEVTSGAASIDWFAEEARRVEGDVLAPTRPGVALMTRRQPVGVVAAITPWNFPFSMITRKVAPALAAGCTVVLKPSETTPLSALALARLAEEAGLPPGALNVVIGKAGPIGDVMTSSPTVRKLTFTGSTKVGKQLAAAAASTVKRVSLELGGNAPVLVFADADLKMAAQLAAMCALRNAGQTCICANRVLVQEEVYDQFAQLVVAKVRSLRLGSGLSPDTTLGPLISPEAVTKVERHVADAGDRGGKILTGGRRATLPAPLDAGSFYEATVIGEVTPEMQCFREETFGPLLPLTKFRTPEEAVAMANDTQYGLAAYAFAKDFKRIWEVCGELEYGMIGVNDVAITSEVAPFGGIKESGLGREQSKYGIEGYLHMKTLHVNYQY